MLLKDDDFKKKLKEVCYRSDFNIDFIFKWYKFMLECLSNLREQQSGISHPRHLGDAREHAFTELLSEILPPAFTITKGFAINSITNQSAEQDCMICKKEFLTGFVRTKDITYVPIDSVLASIEIKSSLAKDDLQKSIINCASIKSLHYKRPIIDSKKDYDKPGLSFTYSPFTYHSEIELDDIIDMLKKLCEDVPINLMINTLYIVNKGFIIPCDPISRERLFSPGIDVTGDYTSIPSMKLKNFSEVENTLPFLWFLACILDNIIIENEKRKFKGTMSYFFEPYIFQQNVNST